MKRKFLFAAVSAAVCLSAAFAGWGCSKEAVEPGKGGDSGDDSPDKVTTFVFATEVQGADNAGFPGEITAYLFGADDVLARTEVYPAESKVIEVEAQSGTHACFVSGALLPAENGVTRRADLLKMSYGADVEHHDSAPEIVAAQTTLDSGNSRVVFARRTARIDLDTSADSRIAVSEIVLLNVPAATCPFTAGGDAGGRTIEYRRSFQSPLSGRHEDLFRLYEKPSAVDVEVRGTYGDAPIFITASIPSVEAGKVYTLSLMNTGAAVEGVFVIGPWQEGDTVVGYPDTEHRITIDRQRSVFSDGMKADYDNNRIEVPAAGGRMTLAFRASTEVDISAVEGGGEYVTVSSAKVDKSDGAVVTLFDVTVSPQGRGRLGYEAVLHLKYALLSGSYDYVTLCVAQSPNQIETVRMAGSDWMAFNARSRDLEEQIYTLDGATVEDMYRSAWIDCTGGLFQFGRMYMYTPWVGYNPSNDLGNQKQNVPWRSSTHMPCPDGYRVPTPDELNALLPDGVTLDGGSATYKTPDGERITAAIFTADGAISTPTGVGGTPRYLKLTSDGGGYLIIPLAGSKGDKSTTNNPGFGQRAVLWTDDNTGMQGGWARTHTVEYNNGSPRMAASRLQMEGFASVRCIREQGL